VSNSFSRYNLYIASPSSPSSSVLSFISQWLVVIAQALRYVVIIANIAYAQIKLKPPSDVIDRWKEPGAKEPEYEAYLDGINGAISGNVFFLGAGFVWTTKHLWGEDDPTEHQIARMKRTTGEGSSWPEQHPAFGFPYFLDFFVTVFALYVPPFPLCTFVTLWQVCADPRLGILAGWTLCIVTRIVYLGHCSLFLFIASSVRIAFDDALP
jgi:hypothetical protein